MKPKVRRPATFTPADGSTAPPRRLDLEAGSYWKDKAKSSEVCRMVFLFGSSDGVQTFSLSAFMSFVLFNGYFIVVIEQRAVHCLNFTADGAVRLTAAVGDQQWSRTSSQCHYSSKDLCKQLQQTTWQPVWVLTPSQGHRIEDHWSCIRDTQNTQNWKQEVLHTVRWCLSPELWETHSYASN